VARLRFIAELPDTIPPDVSWAQVEVEDTKANVLWSTTEAAGTAFWLMNTSSTATKEDIEAASNDLTITDIGIQPNITFTGLTASTQYYFHIFQRDAVGNESRVYSYGFMTLALPITGDIIVTSNAELTAAIAAGTYDVILIAPGNYTLKDMANGLDRTASPLTIRCQDITNKPWFINASQSIQNTHHVNFYGLRFNKDALMEDEAWFWTATWAATAGGCSNIKIENCEFYAPNPGMLNTWVPMPQYAKGLFSVFKFSQYETHNYTLRNNVIKFPYQVGDLLLNGEVHIEDNYAEFWYFDGVRLLGVPIEGRVQGNKYIKGLKFANCIGFYNEVTRSAPHPDNTQGFNVGQNPNNPIQYTDMKIQDLMFYDCIFNPGQYRARSVQSGLSQTLMENVGYVRCGWGTRGNVHGISLEGKGDGVLIQNMTIADVNWGANVWIRIFKSWGEVIVKDTIFKAWSVPTTGPNANVQGFELKDINNLIGYSYSATFTGPLGLLAHTDGINGFIRGYTPRKDFNGTGFLTTSGELRQVPHLPMRAAPPVITPVTGGMQLDTINTPTLMTDYNASLGGTDYTRFDVRWCTAETRVWQTPVLDVEDGDIVNISPGTYWVQTRCVIASGEGLWSYHAVVTVT
jgi:hypothetical protein